MAKSRNERVQGKLRWMILVVMNPCLANLESATKCETRLSLPLTCIFIQLWKASSFLSQNVDVIRFHECMRIARSCVCDMWRNKVTNSSSNDNVSELFLASTSVKRSNSSAVKKSSSSPRSHQIYTSTSQKRWTGGFSGGWKMPTPVTELTKEDIPSSSCDQIIISSLAINSFFQAHRDLCKVRKPKKKSIWRSHQKGVPLAKISRCTQLFASSTRPLTNSTYASIKRVTKHPPDISTSKEEDDNTASHFWTAAAKIQPHVLSSTTNTPNLLRSGNPIYIITRSLYTLCIHPPWTWSLRTLKSQVI